MLIIGAVMIALLGTLVLLLRHFDKRRASRSPELYKNGVRAPERILASVFEVVTLLVLVIAALLMALLLGVS